MCPDLAFEVANKSNTGHGKVSKHSKSCILKGPQSHLGYEVYLCMPGLSSYFSLVKVNFAKSQFLGTKVDHAVLLLNYIHPVGDGMSESDPRAFSEVMVTSEQVIAEETRAPRLIDHL